MKIVCKKLLKIGQKYWTNLHKIENRRLRRQYQLKLTMAFRKRKVFYLPNTQGKIFQA